jgi:SNF2 family DNA or RNA helicase
MLCLLSSNLASLGIPYLLLNGKTTLIKRKKYLKQFQEDEEKKVFLLSLKACGEGLNLTSANNLILVDPWWNPAVEDQAIMRVYR